VGELWVEDTNDASVALEEDRGSPGKAAASLLARAVSMVAIGVLRPLNDFERLQLWRGGGDRDVLIMTAGTAGGSGAGVVADEGRNLLAGPGRAVAVVG